MALINLTRQLVVVISVGGTAMGFSSLLAAPPATSPAPQKVDPEATFRSQIVPFIKKHCLECHGPDAQEGEVRFDQFKDAAAVAADEKTWQHVIQMLRSGAMPPDDSVQPSEQERRSVVNWIERTVYNFDCEN